MLRHFNSSAPDNFTIHAPHRISHHFNVVLASSPAQEMKNVCENVGMEMKAKEKAENKLKEVKQQAELILKESKQVP
jgi:hypothetical protein